MLFYPNERLALFIDGPNLYAAVKGLDFDLDYKRVLELFARKGNLLRAYYYTPIYADADEFTPLKPLIDWLSFNGFQMVTKPMQKFTDSQGRERSKGNIDIELVTDMFTIAPSVDHLVLFSGNGNFRAAIEAIQKTGKRVTVISTIKTSPVMITDDFRRQADNFIELDEIKAQIERA